MTDRVQNHVHAAIFDSTDPAARTTKLMSGRVETVIMNAPPGGTWRHVPKGVHRAADVPPLGELPLALIVTRPTAPRSPRIDSGVVEGLQGPAQ